MRHLRGRLTYANVMATIAVFIALGGAAYAAVKLPKNSVGTKQLKNGAVTAEKVQSGSLTGTQINASTLGTVPNATHAVSADSATQAEQANLLQGKHASDFLGASATAANSNQLEGHPASDFLSASGTAQNSNQLGGLGASSYLGAPVTVHTQVVQGLTEGSGEAAAGAECAAGETPITGGFQETGGNSGSNGLGFGNTYDLRGSGPGVLVQIFPGQKTPTPASAGQTPTLWLVAFTFTSNPNNPEVTIYADCVPDRGTD